MRMFRTTSIRVLCVAVAACLAVLCGQQFFRAGAKKAGLPNLDWKYYYPMTEGSGTTITDVIAGNNGTLSSPPPVWTWGGGLDCDGTGPGAQGTAVGIPPTHMTGSFTIAFSFETITQDNAYSAGKFIGAFDGGFTGWGAGIDITAAHVMEYYSSGGGGWVHGNTAVDDNQVHSYVIVQGPGSVLFYKDGVADGGGGNGSPGDTSQPTTLCAAVASSPAGVQIFNLGFSNHAWNTTEVATYQAYIQPYLVSVAPFPANPETPFPPAFVNVPANGLAQTPPMGWFNFYWVINPTKAQFEAQCSAMASNGMLAAGYNRCELVESYITGFSKAGFPITHPFPYSGSKPGIQVEAEFIHSLGELFGYYTSPGQRDCGGYYGAFGHETRMANSLAAMGVDSVFYDWCNSQTYGLTAQVAAYTQTNVTRASWQWFAQRLQASGRNILLETGPSQPYEGDSVGYGRAAGANTWRYTDDQPCCWNIIQSNWNPVADTSAAGPGGWNNPDVLHTNTGLTDEEGRSQMTQYAIIAAPLIVAGDLTGISPTHLTTLTNSEVIAVNQDALGQQGFQATATVCGAATCEVWIRKISGTNTWAIEFINLDSSAHVISTTWSALNGVTSAFANMSYSTTRDLWAHSSLGTLATGYTTASLPAHGAAMIKIAP
jgi:hypothetical protein